MRYITKIKPYKQLLAILFSLNIVWLGTAIASFSAYWHKPMLIFVGMAIIILGYLFVDLYCKLEYYFESRGM